MHLFYFHLPLDLRLLPGVKVWNMFCSVVVVERAWSGLQGKIYNLFYEKGLEKMVLMLNISIYNVNGTQKQMLLQCWWVLSNLNKLIKKVILCVYNSIPIVTILYNLRTKLSCAINDMHLISTLTYNAFMKYVQII